MYFFNNSPLLCLDMHNNFIKKKKCIKKSLMYQKNTWQIKIGYNWKVAGNELGEIFLYVTIKLSCVKK
jgi:hypothetical protein